ncbi:hypothetical protein LI90_3884 [Carbonactinospora thermoautotrophica]|uniref:Secreted protein n=1 Tax=Carbonactinospora thermoautotrophica TaxID=1469144 RepID=A0A132MYF1_9ACTN|nr:hypothetical protein [Carbonactinospora thermoautotrophica]KWX02837.1 hypothetical protein LI90_3884 [Carbonactinospora thermoautotrophica]
MDGLRARLLSAALLLPLLAGCGGATARPSGATTSPAAAAHTHGHSHAMHDVPADQAPTVALEARPDPLGGWNLRIRTTRFRWAPERANTEFRPGEGHAHLMVDGKKYTRLYGEWFFLPASAVPAGTHVIEVMLNGNDHSAYAVNGQPVRATATVTSTPPASGHSPAH